MLPELVRAEDRDLNLLQGRAKYLDWKIKTLERMNVEPQEESQNHGRDSKTGY